MGGGVLLMGAGHIAGERVSWGAGHTLMFV